MATKTKQRTRALPRAPRPLAPPNWLPAANRLTVYAGLVLVSIAFSTAVSDVYTLPKFIVVCVVGLVLVGLQLWAAATSGAVAVPRSRVAIVVGAIVGVMAVTLLLNDLRLRALFGEYSRNAGLLTYVVAALVLVVVLVDFDERAVRTLALVAAATAGLVVLYGFLQVVGVEPFSTPNGGLVMSFLGQVNFAAGFAGMALPLFLWLAAEPTHHRGLRLAGAVGVLATIVVGVNTDSFQAYVAMAVGAGVLALAFGLDRWSGRTVRLAVAGVLVLGLGVGLVGHNRIETQLRDGFNERVLMWQAGRDMVEHRPVLGYGPAGYFAEFSTYRPPAHAKNFGVFQLVDAPHDVPLSMFVTGGFVLGLLYLGFVGLVGWALVVGLRRRQGSGRLLLGAVGGAWAAYQAQSLISIDVPIFILWHFVLAGAVVVLALAPEARTFRLGWLVGIDGRGRARPGTASRVLQGGAVVLVAIGLVFAVRPLVADAAFARGQDARASDDAIASEEEFAHATALAPWNGNYWAGRAGALAHFGDQDNALAAGIHSADEWPSAVSYALSTAQLAHSMGRDDIADHYFRLSVQRSPRIAVVFRAYADYLVSVGRYPKAIAMAEKAISLRPPGIDDRVYLAQVYDAMGNAAKARATYQKVLELDPLNAYARQALGIT